TVQEEAGTRVTT
nr:immunoglobulin heavy chain junction region [Mus musculus]